MPSIFVRRVRLSIGFFQFRLVSDEGKTVSQVRKSLIPQEFTRLHESLEFVIWKSPDHQRVPFDNGFRPGYDKQSSVRTMGRFNIDALAVGHGSVAVVISDFLRSGVRREVGI